VNERERSGAGAGTSTSRLFCALDLPTGILRRLRSWQRPRGSRPGLRPVRAEALHVTLAFLGERPDAEVPEIGRLVEGIAEEPIEGRLLGAPVPVPRRRPRLFALEIASPGAERLAVSLRGGLEGIGIELPDERPFWPHVTVFRLERPERGRDRARPGPRPRPHLEPLPGGDGHAFGFVRVALYRSQPGPDGSRYARLAAKKLPQAGDDDDEVR
jgi:2'-5' RNA ligase